MHVILTKVSKNLKHFLVMEANDRSWKISIAVSNYQNSPTPVQTFRFFELDLTQFYIL